ncbi:MAG: hypothetical protein V1701_05320 [Planctomycetota bacterium]
MDDVIRLAAYALIFIIIGGASIIKKIIEAQKQRAEMERRRTTLNQSKPGLQTYQVLPEPVAEKQPPANQTEFNLEDILRKALFLPVEELQPKKNVFRQPDRQAVQETNAESETEITTVYSKTAKTQEETTGERLKAISDSKHAFSWQEFMSSLDEKRLSDAQKAIVLTELFNKPVVYRQTINRVR